MKKLDPKIVVLFLLYQLLKAEEIKIDDEIQPGTLITDLASASLFLHEKPEGKVLYRLLSGGSFIDYLHLDGNNGKLFAKRKIDRDSLCFEIELCCKNDMICSISFSVAMTAAQVSSKLIDPIIGKFLIVIEDRNDHKPNFEYSIFNLSISESCPVSTTFQLPLAIDKDSEKYSVKSYKFISKNDLSIFSLETQFVDRKMSVYLRLKNRLDREETDQYSLTIAAVDGGDPALTGVHVVHILVLDVNDNPPIFENTRYSVRVKESQMSSDSIAQVKATDRDIGENAEIFYKLDSGMFRVDELSGLVYMISPLDYEKDQEYKLIITARNRIPGVSTATATLTVNVVNINDEKPMIFVDYFNNWQHASISEYETAPAFVCIVSVRDKDIGIAGKVQCQLDNYHELFDLRQTSPDQYKIHTRQQLDRETNSKYSLSIVCKDQGTPSLTADTIIPVIIIDKNDNKPEINSPSIFHVSENKPPGTIVTKIDATDKDDGLNGKLTYAITDSQNLVSTYLTIDSLTGIIRTLQKIDREATNPPLTKLDLSITVSDSGTPKQFSTKSIQILIDDENDNAPQFAQSTFRFSVTENEAPIYRLGQIEVSDPDETGSIRLGISFVKSNNRKSPFSITSEKNRFWLMTTESLDREELDFYELVIIATDGAGYKSHTVSATVNVTVLDINDNPPVFIFPRPGNETIPKVPYRQQPGYLVLTASANDKDNLPRGNGKLYFSINSNSNNLFNIDPNNGEIRIHRQMGISDIGDHFIIIKVEDDGTPVLSSERQIQIKVQDIPIYLNEGKKSHDESKSDFQDGNGNIFSDRESIFVFALVLILFLVMICICFVVYVRHMKGWLEFLPDLISICHYKEERTSRKGENFIQEDENIQIPQNKYYPNQSNYYAQQYMTAAQPNFPQTPEMFYKKGRDCYEVLKCPPDLSHDPCQIPIMHEHQYNDVLSNTIRPTFQDSYLTMHQSLNEYPVFKENLNSSSFPKPPKSIPAQTPINIVSVNSPEKVPHLNFASSKASYAVSFPTEQSTFV